MLKNSAERESDLSSAKFTVISRQISPDSLLGFSTGICQRALVDELGMIRTEIGMHSRSQNGRSVWDSLYDSFPKQ
jgi:hypothetical protein